MKLDELRALLTTMTPPQWRYEKGAYVIFPNVRGGFCIPRCPDPEGNAEGIVALRNHANDLLAIAEAAQEIDADAEGMFADETDDPRCVDPYIVGRIQFRKLREALKGLK